MKAVLNGQQHRFAELVDRYQTQIVNYVCRMLGNYEDAVDLSQDVFLKAYSALESYRPQYPFPAWLFRIARNAAIDEIRKRRLSTVSLDAPMEFDDGSTPREVESSGLDPEDSYLGLEFANRISAAIDELPEKYREPIVLRHAGGLSYDEIAEAMELPIGTVKTRIFRARDALRQSLGDLFDDESTDPQSGAKQ
ncbi:MAG: sigma-70 family RNA polymerase sigma factor [Acidobacteriota bacterium]